MCCGSAPALRARERQWHIPSPVQIGYSISQWCRAWEKRGDEGSLCPGLSFSSFPFRQQRVYLGKAFSHKNPRCFLYSHAFLFAWLFFWHSHIARLLLSFPAMSRWHRGTAERLNILLTSSQDQAFTVWRGKGGAGPVTDWPQELTSPSCGSCEGISGTCFNLI